jgi:glycosyltransferase involved in cell wall biosynthesis
MADVSVIIPTHNRARLVKGAIDSVLAQSEPVREILVVNDNSTDDTEAVLREYGGAIRVFPASVGGAAAARNIALRVATGEWIGFLDDDDIWLPVKVERQMSLVRDNPELGLVFSADYAVNDDLAILRTRLIAPENRGAAFELLLRGNFIFQSCAMARRDAIERAGYMDPRLRFAPDWDLWLKVAAQYPIDFVPEPLALCRHSDSGCLTRDLATADILGEVQAILERAICVREISRSVQRRARYELELKWASQSLIAGCNREALPHSLRAIMFQPHSWEAHRLLAYSLVPKRARDWAKQLAGRA